jgi:hypothetical protein
MMKVYVYPNHHAFWTSNDAVWEITDRSTGFSKRKTFKFFGIRFDPAGIAELDRQQSHAVGAPAPPAPAITPPSPDKMPVLAVNQAEDEPAQPKPRLSDPALTAWFAAYELAYTKGERTLDHAWDHAKRAFPEKSVTRDRVRALMAGGKPGPRPRG